MVVMSFVVVFLRRAHEQFAVFLFGRQQGNDFHEDVARIVGRGDPKLLQDTSQLVQ